MKTSLLVVCSVFLAVVGICHGTDSPKSIPSSMVITVSSFSNNIITPSPHPISTSTQNSSIHHSSTVHSKNMSSHMHSASKNMSIHNHTSPVPSTMFHNSTIMPNSTISPSPTMNFSVSINITSVFHNASHMTYTVVPTHSINPSNTSSTIMPSSSMVPTTAPPKLPEGKFSVKKGKNSCLLFWLGFEFHVSYKNTNGTKVTRSIIMPESANASGSCDESLSCINIEWTFYSLEACFITAKTDKKNAAEIHWTTANMTISVTVENNPAFSGYGNNTSKFTSKIAPGALDWLSGKRGNSYNCSRQENLDFSNNVSAVFQNIRIQPFEVSNDTFNEHVDVCFTAPPTAPPTSSPKTKKKSGDNTVAIAVGCSLGGLVLIVLIGYFIGKRRKNAIRYRKL